MTLFLDLFGFALLACLALVGILGYLGLHVLAREVIFVDIALAQIAAVGALAATLLAGGHHHAWLEFVLSLTATLAAAAFYAVVRKRVIQIPLEAVIGISYGVALAGALFMLGVAAGGHVHVQHMLAGSVLWTKGSDLAMALPILAGAGIVLVIGRRPIHAISTSYDQALRDGLRVVVWDFLFYATLGVVVATAVRLAGIVLVFACLIMPATLAALLATSTRARLLIAWSTGAAASLAGLLFAHGLDFSVGPSVALFLGVALGLGSLAHVGRPRLAALGAAVVASGLVVLTAVGGGESTLRVGPTAGHQRTEVSRDRGEPSTGHAAAPGISPPVDAGELAARIEAATDAATLRRFYDRAPDPDLRCNAVCRALTIDPRAGVLLALDFLERDPPLFFRQQVLDALTSVEPRARDFQVSTSFRNEPNRSLLRTLRRERERGDAKMR